MLAIKALQKPIGATCQEDARACQHAVGRVILVCGSVVRVKRGGVMTVGLVLVIALVILGAGDHRKDRGVVVDEVEDVDVGGPVADDEVAASRCRGPFPFVGSTVPIRLLRVVLRGVPEDPEDQQHQPGEGRFDAALEAAANHRHVGERPEDEPENESDDEEHREDGHSHECYERSDQNVDDS